MPEFQQLNRLGSRIRGRHEAPANRLGQGSDQADQLFLQESRYGPLQLLRVQLTGGRQRNVDRQPILIIAGQKDTFTPAWLSRRMARLVPDAQMLLVPLGTHVAPLEQPELIELRLSRFLEENLPLGKPRPRKRKAARRPAATKKPRRRAAEGPKA